MILNIRGTSGSGKTWLIRRIMEELGPPEPIISAEGEKPDGYLLQGNIRLVGSYENVCGGCDAVNFSKHTKAILKRWPKSREELLAELDALHISEPDKEKMLSRLEKGKEAGGTVGLVEARVRSWAAIGHVIFEGLIISGSYWRFQKIGGVIFAFLDTPLDLCTQRIMERNGGKPVKFENTKSKWDDARSTYQIAVQGGEQAVWIDHTCAFEQVMEIIYGNVPELREGLLRYIQPLELSSPEPTGETNGKTFTLPLDASRLCPF